MPTLTWKQPYHPSSYTPMEESAVCFEISISTRALAHIPTPLMKVISFERLILNSEACKVIHTCPSLPSELRQHLA